VIPDQMMKQILAGPIEIEIPSICIIPGRSP
jgi:hypothetical protein